MMRVLAVALIAVPLAACVPAGRPAQPMACVADPAQRFVGEEATPGRVERARRATKASTVRVISPGMAVTMDYRYDRLNLEVDNAGRILTARCG